MSQTLELVRLLGSTSIRHARHLGIWLLVSIATAFSPLAAGAQAVLIWMSDRVPEFGVEMVPVRGRSEGELKFIVAAYLEPGFSTTGAWEVKFSEGLVVREGPQTVEGPRETVSAHHETFLMPTKPGEFRAESRIRGTKDSLNWCEQVRVLRFRIEGDSIQKLGRPTTTYSLLVLDGVRYQQAEWAWIPLDPGEHVTGSETRVLREAPRPLRSEAARIPRPRSRADSSRVQVIVAVGRNGQVKGARISPLPGLRFDLVVEQAVISAALKWKFRPAKVDGRVVSAAYKLWVPIRFARSSGRAHAP